MKEYEVKIVDKKQSSDNEVAKPRKAVDHKGLRYDELLSPIIKAIQDLSKIVNKQQKQIDSLLQSNNSNDTETIVSDIDFDEENKIREQLEEIERKNRDKLKRKKSKLSFQK